MAKVNLVIEGHRTDSFGSPAAFFTVPINPEQIQISRGVAYNNDDKGTDTAGNTPRFVGYENDDISFDIHLDGTGIASKNIDVGDEIEALHKACYDYHGDIHKPYYIKLSWNKFKFNCRLKSISTTYTLFSSDGSPLRAKISLAFIGYISVRANNNQALKSSPDMTHVKTVRYGDSLPVMCKDVYGEIKYYPQVAKINNLINFRKLEIGSRLYFPPLEN